MSPAGPSRRTRHAPRTWSATPIVALVALVAVLAIGGCGDGRPSVGAASSPAQIIWLAGDLLVDHDAGRYFATCKDQDDELREKTV